MEVIPVEVEVVEDQVKLTRLSLAITAATVVVAK